MSVKFVAMGCLHGSLKKEVIELIKKEKPDAVLISGDFTGGDYSEELRKYESDLVNTFGPISEFWPLEIQIESDKKFRKWGRIALRNNKKIFERLKKLDVPIYYIHGNWDSVSVSKNRFENTTDFLIDEQEGKNMKFIHKKIVKVKGISILGFGGYRGTSAKEYLLEDIPGFVVDKNPVIEIRDKMKTKIEKLFSKVKDKRKMIFLTHDPPYKTFDYLESAKKFYGEKVTLEIIKKYKPLACVCSHFHEHRGSKKIGVTNVIATGFGQKGQVCIITIDESKVKTKFIG